MSDDNKLGPPPVEPISDLTWARVERGLWSRIDSGATDARPAPRRRWLWVAVPAFAIAAAAALLLATGVLGSRDDAPVIATIEEPSRVVAGAAPSAVSFGDAHIDLAAESAILMTREGDSPSVLLERGSATFAVAPRKDRAPFVVRAGDTVVRVVGTRFVVSRSEELITVAVEHGLVDVQFRGETHRIGTNQTWSSEAPDKVAMQTPEVHTAKPDTTPAPHTPDIQTAPDKNRTSVTPDTKTSPDMRAGARDTHTTTGPEPQTGARPRMSAKDPEGAKYDLLVAMERNDPAGALLGYLELSKGSSKWAGVALYAAGRLAADRNDHRAVTFLDIYLRRFPNGANADDARNLLARFKGDAP